MSTIPTPFNSGDDGKADDALLSALATQDPAVIVEALREKRLFVAVVAILVSRDERGGEKESEMALALLEHEGEQILPVFTSVDAMHGWRSDARPVAVLAEAAAMQALADGMAGLLIDPIDSHAAILSTPAVRALVLGYAFTPFHEDPQVLSALDRAVAAEPAAATAWIDAADGVDATITVLIPDLPAEAARPIAERIAAAVSADEHVRVRVERGIDIQVVAAR